MACYCHFKGQKYFVAGDDFKRTYLGGFLQAVSVCGVIGALVFLPGPLVLITLFTFPFLLLLYLIYRREMPLTAGLAGLTLLALLGLSFVLDVWSKEASLNFWGLGLALVAAVATACRMYVYGRQLEAKSPFVVGAENFIVAFLCTLPLLLWKGAELPNDLTGYLWTLLSIASLVLGSFGMFVGLALIGSFSWSLLSKLEPLFVAIYSAILLGEVLKPSQYVGMGVVLAALVAYQLTSKPKEQKG